MHITSIFTAKTYRDYHWHHQFSSGKWATSFIGVCIFAALSIYCFIKVSLLYGILLLILSLIIGAAWISKNIADISMQLRYMKLDIAPYEAYIEFSDDGLITYNERNEEKVCVKWVELHRVFETKKYIYFYINKEQAIILIKADVSSVDLDSIRKLAKLS